MPSRQQLIKLGKLLAETDFPTPYNLYDHDGQLVMAYLSRRQAETAAVALDVSQVEQITKDVGGDAPYTFTQYRCGDGFIVNGFGHDAQSVKP